MIESTGLHRASGDVVRQRAGVILFIDGRLVVVDRDRPGVGRYQVLPGGGVEPGESLALAAAREMWEETGLRAEVSEQPCLRLTRGDQVQWLFHATPVGGTFGTGTGLEVTGGRPDRGVYRPALVTCRELASMNLVPTSVAELVLRAWSTGVWWDQAIMLDDPHGQTPVRVRAGAIVVRGGSILVIQRAQRGERWFEIPGGGVEPDETPAGAVVRELREETGLVGSVRSEVATVLKDRGRQHYFLIDAVGDVADRASLDLDDDASPMWLPVAELAYAAVWPKRLAWRVADWCTTGWPNEPVQLCDSIVDLTQPCDW
jgi:8-oxo-dGTP diphosphatase